METSIEEREAAFRREVYEVGGMIYTKKMLDNFANSWCEPDRAPGKRQKLKFEKQKTWKTSLRLAKWAENNYNGIQCYLTDSQKTIQQKKKSFAVQLEPYLGQYDKATLNAFYSYWATPENKPNPEYLRWEKQEYWELSTRLAQWAAKNVAVTVNPMLR